MAKTETNKINKVEQDNGSDTLINHNSLNKSGDNNNNNNNNKSAKTLNNSDSNNSNSNNIYLDPTLQNIDTTSIPTFPQAPHHAPPQDSSELTSPWWSAESTEVPDTTNSTSSTSDTNTNNTNNIKEPNNPLKSEELSHFFVSFSRQATDRKNGDTVWREDCLIWTKEPRHQKESKLVDEIKETAITRSQQQPSLSPLYSSSSSSSSSSNINNDNDNSNQNNNTKKGYPLNTQCTMICLFRESQQRKLKKLKDMEMSNTWNPFYGNWLVLTKTRSAFAEHIAESDIVKKDSPDYYSVELGERFGHIGVDVTKFFAKTFTPVQELGRRYIESWNDGTQSRFFNRFFESAKSGDAFFLVRDSARRMVQNMMNTEEKKKEDDDHK
ncbi:unnamed protein product [Cunninghamella echinulata]